MLPFPPFFSQAYISFRLASISPASLCRFYLPSAICIDILSPSYPARLNVSSFSRQYSYCCLRNAISFSIPAISSVIASNRRTISCWTGRGGTGSDTPRVDDTHSASYTSGLIHESFGGFQTKPNTQDCSRTDWIKDNSHQPSRIEGSSRNGITPTWTIPSSSASGLRLPEVTTILRKKSPLHLSDLFS